MDEATRVIYWNIPYHQLVYVFSVIPVVIFIWGFARIIRLIAIGKPDKRLDHFWSRVKDTLLYALGQGRVLQSPLAGIAHGMIFFGFLTLFIGTSLDTLHGLFNLFDIRGWFYLILSLSLDVLGLAVLIGIIIAAFRRYLLRPKYLDIIWEDGVILPLIALVIISGFLVESLRIAVLKPPFEVWSIVSWYVAPLFAGVSEDTLLHLHRIAWWTHMTLSFAFIAYIPFSKLRHIFTAAASIFFRSSRPHGELPPTEDLDKAESFGVATINQFGWKDLLDIEACTRCGRCENACPAFASEKPLNPKKLVLDLRTNLHKWGKSAIRTKGKDLPEDAHLLPHSITADELWACTTCRACMQECPILVEHIPKIVELRREQVLMQSAFPHELTLTFKNMENNSNPWGLGWAERGKWVEELGVKTLAEDAEVDYLYYMGCMGSFDERAKKVAESFIRLCQKAEIKLGVLGSEEKCCGDSARRAGNEYLSYMMMLENIETFNKYKVARIVTTCPHGYNTIKNEYPRFGGRYAVFHSSEVLADLISDGRLAPLKKSDQAERVVYHDSCYLGRYNGLYNEPRKMLRAIPGITLVEAKKHRNKSFCCGAGGGRMWMEETIGKRISEVRLEELLKESPQTLATACTFCLTMFEDALKAKNMEEEIAVRDITELLWQAQKPE
jgi:Fe-S oxidoreductase/nitrate reductase gamma subunit